MSAPFSRRSAFDEALSRPLVPPSDGGGDDRSRGSGGSGSGGSGSGGGKKKTKKKKAETTKGAIGTSGRGSSGAAAFSSSSSSSSAAASSGKYRPPPPPSSAFAFSAPASAGAPPSAVSSVVSDDDDDDRARPAAAAAFDSAPSASFEASRASRAPGSALELQQEHGDLEEALLRERHEEFAEVARNMGIVRDIHRDLSAIVDSQQSDIDDIEENALEVQESTERGLGQLERARGHMKSGGKWSGAIMTSVACTSVVAAVVFWLLAK